MPSTEVDPTPFRCVTCEAVIRTTPVFYVGLAFCCAGCVADGPCLCSYDPLPAREERPVTDPLPGPRRLPARDAGRRRSLTEGTRAGAATGRILAR